jgi:hypothetical protein
MVNGSLGIVSHLAHLMAQLPNPAWDASSARRCAVIQVIGITVQTESGTAPALSGMWPALLPATDNHRSFSQVHTLNLRQVAVSLSGAFVAAMLFVSAAVGPLPVA